MTLGSSASTRSGSTAPSEIAARRLANDEAIAGARRGRLPTGVRVALYDEALEELEAELATERARLRA